MTVCIYIYVTTSGASSQLHVLVLNIQLLFLRYWYFTTFYSLNRKSIINQYLWTLEGLIITPLTPHSHSCSVQDSGWNLIKVQWMRSKIQTQTWECGTEYQHGNLQIVHAQYSFNILEIFYFPEKFFSHDPNFTQVALFVCIHFCIHTYRLDLVLKHAPFSGQLSLWNLT